jgi:hypothetical protein
VAMPTNPKNTQEKERLPEEDRRRSKRVPLVFQIEVCGTDTGGAKFSDLTTTEDINEHGCRFGLQRELRRGQVVSIRVVSRNAGAVPESEPQRFEIVWVEASMHGWVGGAVRLQNEPFWPVSFPAKISRP